jgi:hypothetical protein
MTFPDPAALLRHRPPAVLVRDVIDFTGARLTCASAGDGPWTWPQLLEGGAQTAGLLAGAQPNGLSNQAVIADYRAVRLHAAGHTGPVVFAAEIDRRVMQFWRCRIVATATNGRLLLEGTVTLAPPGSATAAA